MTDELKRAALAVEKWWVEEGQNSFNGAPACMFALRSALSVAAKSERANAEKDAALTKLLPGAYYMDPPDGGSVTLLEQLERMSQDAERYRCLRSERGEEMTDDEINQFAHAHLYRSLRPIGLNEFARAIEAHVLKEARRTVSGQEAKPVAEVVNKYGDPDSFAERELIVNEEILKTLPFGTQLFAAPIPATDSEKDAERYRWLRDNGEKVQKWGCDVWFPYDGLVAKRLDNAIDAAILAANGEKK